MWWYVFNQEPIYDGSERACPQNQTASSVPQVRLQLAVPPKASEGGTGAGPSPSPSPSLAPSLSLSHTLSVCPSPLSLSLSLSLCLSLSLSLSLLSDSLFRPLSLPSLKLSFSLSSFFFLSLPHPLGFVCPLSVCSSRILSVYPPSAPTSFSPPSLL